MTACGGWSMRLAFFKEMPKLVAQNEKYKLSLKDKLGELDAVLDKLKVSMCLNSLLAVFNNSDILKDKIKTRKSVVSASTVLAPKKEELMATLPKNLQKRCADALKLK